MTLFERSKAKGTDILSALVLLIAVLLAGGHGSLTAYQPSIPAPQHLSLGDTGNGGQRSAPVILKKNLLAIETRDAKPASWDDGKPKPFRASIGFELSSTAFREIPVLQPVATLAHPVASFFDARAPPANA